MAHDIRGLLTRNLHEVFGEGDPRRRRAAIEDHYTEDAAFYAPDGIHRGHEAIDRNAGAVRATHPDFRYTEIGEAEEVQGAAGRLKWVSGKPGEAPAYAGSDFILVRDGRIAALYLFFDDLPA